MSVEGKQHISGSPFGRSIQLSIGGEGGFLEEVMFELGPADCMVFSQGMAGRENHRSTGWNQTVHTRGRGWKAGETPPGGAWPSGPSARGPLG